MALLLLRQIYIGKRKEENENLEIWLLDSASCKNDITEGAKLTAKRRLKNHFKVKHITATLVLSPM